jgi:DNA-binding NtrC family response regulator
VKLLVVDDCSEILEYMRRLLTHRGHEVLALRCNSEPEAAEILEDVGFLKFDVALVGFNMLGVLGTALAVHISKLSPSTKVIIAIEPIPPEEGDRVHRQGIAFGQLPAPFEPEELFRQLVPL